MPTSKSKNKPIGITLGDPAGIGPEVIAKGLSKKSIRDLAEFVIIGDENIYSRFSSRRHKNISFINPSSSSQKKNQIGKPSRTSALASYAYLEKSIELLKRKKIRALVTGPVCKETLAQIVPEFCGHTEFLAQAFGVKEVGMLFVADTLRTIVVTRHIPLNKVSRLLTPQKLTVTIELLTQALKNHFKIPHPKIAVCGLNPHAGEGGKIGSEEVKIILPVIQKMKKRRINISGPFASDTLFSNDVTKRYDAVVAMYHDQGLIPLKTLCFSKLVNMTIGLPFVRTSPAHGTAFNIAGKKKADPTSMAEAIKLAAQLSS